MGNESAVNRTRRRGYKGREMIAKTEYILLDFEEAKARALRIGFTETLYRYVDGPVLMVSDIYNSRRIIFTLTAENIVIGVDVG